jgi:hypothetical protein
VKSLLHLGLEARAAREVSVTTTGSKCCGASGEIVVRQWREAARRRVAIAPAEAGHVLVTRRVERRRIGGHLTVGGEATVVLCGLPVDGLKAILKLSRRTELPFANNGPDDGTATDGRGEYDEDCSGGVREA